MNGRRLGWSAIVLLGMALARRAGTVVNGVEFVGFLRVIGISPLLKNQRDRLDSVH